MVNLADQQLAILVVAFIDAELPTALVNLITTHDDERLCVRGTILLAKVCSGAPVRSHTNSRATRLPCSGVRRVPV
jgi:hypothetical protein